VRVDHHLDLISLEMLERVGYSYVAIEARYYKFLRDSMGCDFLRKRRIKNSQDGGSWAAMRLWCVFVNPLSDHFHEILNVKVFGGLGGLALIGVFLMVWGCESATPSIAPSASDVYCARL